MAWKDWHYIPLVPTGRGNSIAGYKSDIPEDALRLFINDDTDMHSEESARNYCHDYLSVTGGKENCPTERPVYVYYSDSFELASTLFKPAMAACYQFDGICQDLIDDESREYTGFDNLEQIKQGALSPHPALMVVTNDGAWAGRFRQERRSNHLFAIAKEPDAKHRKKPEAEEIRAFFTMAEQNRDLSNDPLIQEYRYIIGNSILRRIREFIGYLDDGRRYGQTPDAPRERMPVVILGESGTGKEAVARLIHAWDRAGSDPKFQRFQPVLIAGIPEGVLEGELFGVENLAQGRLKEKDMIKGYLRLAEHGTYFQDEVGDLPLSIQGKLLRFLQQREIRPVGADKWITLEDVRCVFATNRNLIQAAEGGKRFRQDFLQRIDGLTLELPSLKEREEDHETLINFFLGRYAAAEKSEHSQPLTDEVMQILLDKCRAGEIRGNVRELKNQIRRLVQIVPQGRQIDKAVFERAQEHTLFPLSI